MQIALMRRSATTDVPMPEADTTRKELSFDERIAAEPDPTAREDTRTHGQTDGRTHAHTHAHMDDRTHGTMDRRTDDRTHGPMN